MSDWLEKMRSVKDSIAIHLTGISPLRFNRIMLRVNEKNCGNYCANFKLLVHFFRNFPRSTFSSPCQSRPLWQLHRQRVEYCGQPNRHGEPVQRKKNYENRQKTIPMCKFVPFCSPDSPFHELFEKTKKWDLLLKSACWNLHPNCFDWNLPKNGYN